MTAVAAPTVVKFHLSLNVASLDRSVAFFQTLFGQAAAKCRPDYAKFELNEPPVVLSLEPSTPSSSGALNHLGFRLADAGELVEWQRRLEAAGIATQREEGVECCYARQTKFWVRDPDNNLWEIYVLDEDLEHRGLGQAPETLPPVQARPQSVAAPAKAIWQHQLGTPLPERIFAHSAAVDEILLRGSFNAVHSLELRRRFLGEAWRILAPGGTVLLHLLTGQRTLSFPSQTLPGPAAYVTHVPALTEILADLAAAGFSDTQITKYGSHPCFVHEGVALRETMFVGRKRAATTADAGSGEVIYLGPLAVVRDDAGRDYPRGQRVTVSDATWAAMAQGPLAPSFVRLDEANAGSCIP